MPRLSDSMEEGTIIRWLVADGATVKRGEEIVEIETDKANMTYEADAAGVLTVVAPEGSTVAVGGPIAVIGDGAATAASPPSAGAPAAVPAGPVDSGRAHTALSGGARASSSPPAGSAAALSPSMPVVGGASRVSASPVARRQALALGVDLAVVAGSGPRGRILKADVVAAANGAAPAAAASAPAPAAGGKGAVAVQELSRLQQTVARRMSESKATVPDFAIEVDVDMTEAVALRAQLKALAQGPAPSLNDLLVKAVALALRAHPRVNGSYRDGRFETYERVNVGVAVATDEGLVVPTVHDADRRSVGELAAEVRRLAERVREGTITPPELAAGTFTVSNLGMFGVDRFAGVVNPPQAAILCAGAVRRRPAVAPDGSLAARELMTLTLVSDHRILYGADAARFLADVRAALEAPLRLLL